MPTARESITFDPKHVGELLKAAMSAMAAQKSSIGEMQIVASALLIGLSKRINLSPEEAERELAMNWDLPQAQALCDGLAKRTP